MSQCLRRLVRLLPLAALLAGSQLPAAQTGRIVGTITDADGALVGVTLRLLDTDRVTTTNADGAFEIAGLASGGYVLRATSVGYDPLDQAVTVSNGETVRLDLRLVRADARLGEVVVEGRSASLVGRASAASDGVVGQRQLALRPLLRVGEVLETIPGAVVTQHSGSGKANQFFLRGFNLDHGTDFAASVEGVPINLPTHAHGQGYLDLNFLIPEVIQRVAFAKGPLAADAGNFATAGRAQLRIARTLDRDIAEVEAGSDDRFGALVAGSRRVGDRDVLVAVRGRYTDGPWVTPEDGSLVSAVAKVSGGDDARGYSLTALGYANDWTATDQVAQRAVASGRIDRLGSLDQTSGGTTGRYTLAARAHRSTAAGQTEASAYAAYYHLNLFSNFTYFLDDPVRGDQFEQADRRLYVGADASHRWTTRRLGRSTALTVGAGLRHDEIFEVGLHRTEARERFATIRDDAVAETSAGTYVEAETRWTSALRTVLGVRADAFRFDVASDIDANSGTETDLIASPRASVALGLGAGTEVYAGAGLGFHSNDARGTTIRVDPATGEAVGAVDPLVRTRGAEVGVRTTAVSGLQSTVSLFAIGLDSELVFVGDAGGTEASDASRHVGVEWASYLDVTDWLDVALDVALTRSRFTDGEADGERIENSVGRVITGGVYAGRASGPVAAVQVRHLGPRPLDGAGAVTAPASTLVNARLGWRSGALAVALDVLNALDEDAADVSYLYESRLAGEATATEDIHAHPVLPRSARLTLGVRL